jgi:hypothetical protein
MRRAIIGTVLVTALLSAAPAAASGPPPTTTSASKGVVALGGSIRYVARPGGGGTVVQRVSGGRVAASRSLAGRWGVPAVAQDGSASGLSADGRTLVLASRGGAYPARTTRYAVLHAGTLRVHDRVTLRGTFGFDAISPDGGTLYLIRYAGGNPTDYAVRAYDVQARRLLAKPIIDSHEPDEQMRGFPLTRTISRDGTWAYTLYGGTGGTPFVHALDTRHRTARCIDVPAVANDTNLGAIELRLSADGRRLSAVDGPTTITVVDTRTFRVSTPPLTATPQPVTPARAPATGGNGSSVPWGLIGGIGAALALAGAAVAVAVRRGRGPGATEVRPD